MGNASARLVAAQPKDEARVITLGEAAEIINCSYSTVLRLVRDGELKAFRVRGAWRTSTRACREFVERGFEEQRISAQSQGTK